MKVGNNIKKIRELKNIKQEYVANQLEISITSYGKLERNEVDINLSRLHNISVILSVPMSVILSLDVDHLLSSENSSPMYGQIIISMQEVISSLSQENQRLLCLLEKTVR